MQGVHDNYDTDTSFLVEASADIANVDLNGDHHSNRVADHIRSAFLIADGVLPSNETGDMF